MTKAISTLPCIAALLLILFAAPPAPAATFVPDANTPRAAVPASFRWDTRVLFQSDGAWESAVRDLQNRITAIAGFRGQLRTTEDLAGCLAEFFAARQKLNRLSLFSTLRMAEDETAERANAMRQRTIALANTFNLETAFLRQKILRLSEQGMAAVLGDAALSPYRGFIDDLRRRKAHALDSQAERVLALAGDSLWSEIDISEIPSDVEMIFKASMRDIALPTITDEAGAVIQLTLATYGKYRASKDRRVRREAVEALFGTLAKEQDVLAATLGAEIKRDVFLARARKYDRAVDAFLDRQNVPPAVMDTLIKTVRANMRPLHRYVELRKKLLGLPDLHLYDLYPAIVPAAETDIPYTEGLDDILTALAPLGEDYVGTLSAGVRPGDGWVDVYPNKGKESGAFCSAVWNAHPFVKLNYLNDIDDVLTAAHEFGHAMHSAINAKAQPYETFGYSTFTAEIASTFNEMLVLQHLLKKYAGDDRMQLFLLGNLLETIRTTIYRQTLFSEFERKVHAFAEAGEPITATLLNATYRDLIRAYYGPGLTLDDNDGIEWAYIPHFYWKYYVFSYATGLASGIALAEKVGAGDTGARDRYLAMLREPTTAAPLEILKKAGLDLTGPGVVTAAARLMDATVTQMEKIFQRMIS